MKSCFFEQKQNALSILIFLRNLTLVLSFAPVLHMNAQSINYPYGPNGDGIYPWSPGTTSEVFYDAVLIGTEIIAVGHTDYDENEGGNYRGIVVKLNYDGIPVWGPVHIDYPNSSDEIYGVALQSDGKIVLAGSTDDANGILRPALFRLNASGTPDNTFGTGGRAIFTASVGRFRDVAVLPNGKIVACGLGFDASSDFATLAARYNSNGQLDVTFNGGYNIFKVGIGSGDEDEGAGLGLAVQSDGKIVICGYTESGSEDVAYVARLTTGGVLDVSLEGGGKKIFYVSGATISKQYARTVGIDGAGRIVVGGHVVVSGEDEFFLARFLTNGIADNSFASYGYKVYPGISSSSYEYGLSLAFQSDGKMLLAGHVNFDAGLIRVKNDGSLDATFDNDGFYIPSTGLEYSEVNKILTDGSRIYLVGAFTPSGGSILDDDGMVLVLDNTTVVGLDEVNSEVSVRLFPNPANEAVHLEITDQQTTGIAFEMFDMLGRRVASEKIDDLQKRSTISTAALPGGTYRLIIYREGEIVKTAPLIIAH